MAKQEPNYRSNVYNALKGELGDSFTKTEEEFYSALDNEEGYSNKVYSALKSELGDSFTKTEDDFINLIGLKKKEETTPRDFTELGRQLGKNFQERGKGISAVQKTQAEQKSYQDLLEKASSDEKDVEPGKYDYMLCKISGRSFLFFF